MTASVQYQMTEAGDGREIEVLIEGAEDGFPLLYHAGTPAAAAPFPALAEAACERGLKLISYSRAGYGNSSPRPAGTVTDDMDDVGALLADHGVDDFITVGWSGGGSRAVASAALFPGRCRAAAAMAALGPYDVEDLDWYAGMSRWMQDLYRAAANDPAAHAEVVATMGAEYGELTVDGMRATMASMGEPELDIQVARTDVAQYVAEAMRRSQIQGPDGWRCDDRALISPWGFDCESITVPLAVWYGGQDDTCPAVHSEWLIAHTPTAVGHYCEDDGHLSLARHLGDILNDLRQLAGLAS